MRTSSRLNDLFQIARCPVPACCGESCSIWTERNANNRIAVTNKGKQLLPRRGIPHFYFPIEAGCCETRPIRTESNSRDGIAMTAQSE